jgi:hypothetical protein
MHPSTMAAYVYLDSFWTSAHHVLTIRSQRPTSCSLLPRDVLVRPYFYGRRFELPRAHSTLKKDVQLKKAASGGRVNTHVIFVQDGLTP